MKWMEINMTPEYLKEGIERELELGNIMFQKHPKLPLKIYNYTRTCQFEKAWNPITLICRGLVLDFDYNIVARPLAKFFNWEELKDFEEENAKGIIPWHLPYEVFNKEDGSLGIIFEYNNVWMVASRGSFTSDQAIKANEMLKKYSTDLLIPGFTYCVEIVYPENRIVVDYGKEEKLILLAVINNESGAEIDLETDFERPICFGANIPPAEFKALNTHNKEGGVFRFSNGFRIKVKFEEYCALHAVVTNITSYDIWRHLMAGKPMEDLLQLVPDEIDDWVKNQVSALEDNYKAVEKEYQEGPLKEVYKAMAEAVAKLDPKYDKGLVFAMAKGRDYSSKIYKKVKPEYEKAYSKIFHVQNTAEDVPTE